MINIQFLYIFFGAFYSPVIIHEAKPFLVNKINEEIFPRIIFTRSYPGLAVRA